MYIRSQQNKEKKPLKTEPKMNSPSQTLNTNYK